jgi:hypothetical protein
MESYTVATEVYTVATILLTVATELYTIATELFTLDSNLPVPYMFRLKPASTNQYDDPLKLVQTCRFL